MKCWWIFFHNWEKWKDCFYGGVDHDGNYDPKVRRLGQERICKLCGRKQGRFL